MLLNKIAFAVIAFVGKLPVMHGSGSGSGLIRRAAADNSKKADKGSDNDDEYESLSVSESIETNPSDPEPLFFSIENGDWNHGATSVTQEYDGTIKFYAPHDTKVGDTLFLFLSRTDGFLPLRIGIGDEWTRGAECFKSFNRQQNCMCAIDCVKREGPYCLEFDHEKGGGDGKDLGTVVFYRHVTADDPGCWTVELPGKTTVWAIVTAIPGVNRERPIFRTLGASCDVSNVCRESQLLHFYLHLYFLILH